MKKRKGVVDLPVKVVHKANEMTKLLCLNEAAPDILIQFKRLVNNSFPDFFTESLIQLEYEGAEGDFVVVDDDDTLQSAIAQLIGRGQVPKFWASCLEARVGASSQKEAGAVIPQSAKLQSTVKSLEDPESRIFGVEDKMSRLQLCASSAVTVSGDPTPSSLFDASRIVLAGKELKAAGPNSAGSKLQSHKLNPVSTRELSSLSTDQLGYWVHQQFEKRTSTNIEDLSSEDNGDYKVFVSILERRDLSELVVDKLVELLTREGIRSSMMRHKTSRIYGLVIGSPFMIQLQSQIEGLLNPTPRKVHTYVKLVEELQTKTSDGWKKVPLDAIKRVVDDMTPSEEEGIRTSSGLKRDTAMDELLEDVNRLLEQRDKWAGSTANYNSQEEEFLRLPILPSEAELMDLHIVSRPLPINQVGRRYSSVFEYLKTHFQLLREDYIEPLRQGINALKNRDFEQSAERRLGLEAHPEQHLNIYVDVRFEPGFKCGREGIQYQVAFRTPGGRNIDWETSKRLMYGSLLCVSEDGFQTFFWAQVVGRYWKDLSRGRVNVRCIKESDLRAPHKSPNSEDESAEDEASSQSTNLRWFERSQRFLMVEANSAYFEAYYHVLKSLQREDMCRQLVFTKHLIDLEPEVGPPSYLARRPQHGEFNFRTVFPELMSEIGRDSFDILSSWPEWKNSTLDDSQKKALEQGLTKELAIIQGPPGTGKTFVGLLLVRALLENLRTQESELPMTVLRSSCEDTIECKQDDTGPILVVCYTNHALDQFLLGIYEFEKNLIRVGGRSKHELLLSRNLRILVQDHRRRKRASKAARAAKKKFLLHGQAKYLHLANLLIVNSRALFGVATPEQVKSLFQWKHPAYPDTGLTDEEIVQIWLAGSEKDFLNDISGDIVNGVNIFSVNKFDVMRYLQDEDDEAVIGTDDPCDAVSIGSDLEYQATQEPQEAEATGQETNSEQENGEHLNDLDVEYDEDSTLPQNDENDVLGEQRHAVDDDAFSDNLFTSVTDVWILHTKERLRLHEAWLSVIKKNAREQLERFSTQYKEACQQHLEVEKELELALLRKAKVVGMTTTAGARLHDLLVSLRPAIVIVEEAAEVLESSVLACLSPYTKHLILIGDHQQLRPLVSVHKLAVNNSLDVSLFERLVTSGVEFRTLEFQRRMRPSISELLLCLYPNLRDHASVIQYPDVKGVMNNVFFLDHKAEERSCKDWGTGSKVNEEEAAMVVEFCVYLLKQGCYSPADITILSTYSGQVQEIKRLLRSRMYETWPAIFAAKSSDTYTKSAPEVDLPRVSSVDGFQGEESNIILLSLVRSNQLEDKDGPGKIGFLSIPNRVCVAISRARIGFYLFGNAELLAAKSALWKNVLGTLAESNSVGSHLTLCCQKHPGKETRVAQARDFEQVADGGCSRPCEFQLPCGHVCPRRCHPGNHDSVACIKTCRRRYETCKHACTQRCHEGSDCPPCMMHFRRVLPKCGHHQLVACSSSVNGVMCHQPCTKLLECGHPCTNTCGQYCVKACCWYVWSTLPCGHPQQHLCREDPESIICRTPCMATLAGCNHECQGTCGECKQRKDHTPCNEPCQRLLPCGHRCQGRCSDVCPPCEKACEKRCVHSICSLKCGEPCLPCMEKCVWGCRHHSCGQLCYETCTRPRCNRRCNRRLKGCGHRCSGICGEPCPQKCKICHGDTIDSISQMKFQELKSKDRLIQLQDCKHVFEVTGLDSWMDQDDKETELDLTAVLCSPQCTAPVRRSAIQLYRQALKYDPGLPEAHLAIGCAFAGSRATYARASYHFQYLILRYGSEFKLHFQDGVRGAELTPCPAVSATADADALKAMVQWASVLTKMKEFDRATQLCDAVLEHYPGEEQAGIVKRAACAGQTQEVVAAVSTDLRSSGHWYECPNGHIYAVGECGGPMERSRCPDCDATIVGERHTSHSR